MLVQTLEGIIMENMIEKNDRIAIRTNKLLKEKATAVFAKNQVDLSTAINMFLKRAVEEDRIPLDFRTPEQLEAEYQWLEKRLLAAEERRKNETAVYYTLDEVENMLDTRAHHAQVVEPTAEYKADDKD